MKSTDFLTTRQVSALLTEKIKPTSVSCLKQWRFRGVGPRYSHLVGRVLYHKKDIEAWIKKKGGRHVCSK